jgi:hypothetical protein
MKEAGMGRIDREFFERFFEELTAVECVTPTE